MESVQQIEEKITDSYVKLFESIGDVIKSEASNPTKVIQIQELTRACKYSIHCIATDLELPSSHIINNGQSIDVIT